MWKVSLKGLIAHKYRLALTSIAVVLGVAFMAGTFVLTDTLGNLFTGLFESANQGVAAVVRAKQPFTGQEGPGGAEATRPPVPDTLLPELASTPGVRAVEGSIQGVALVVGKDGKALTNLAGAPNLGVAWSDNPDFPRALHLVTGHAPASAGEMGLDEGTAKKGHFRVGDRARVVFLSVPPQEFTISGIFKFGDAGNLAGATLAGFQPATAQRVMNRVGEWDSIEFAAKPGVSQTELRDALAARLRELPDSARYEAVTGQKVASEQAGDVKKGLGFFNTILLIFAAVSLFVGAFIIYNTFSIIVAQRARELALLRALGASGRQVTTSVGVEALGVGLFSSVVGIGLGVLFAIGLKGLLAGLGVGLPSGTIEVLPRTIIVSLVVGTLVTLVSAVSPARRAARVPPVAAMRDQASTPSSGSRRYVVGGILGALGLLLGGVGLFSSGKFGGVPGGRAGLVGIGAGLVFIGLAMLSPLFARPVAMVVGWVPARLRGLAGRLARENAVRNPRRTASTAAALMIGLALVSLVAIFGASAKSSFSKAIDTSLHADFVLSGKGFQGFSPQAVDAARRALPGATVVEFRPGSWQEVGASPEAGRLSGSVRQLAGVTPGFQKVLDLGLRHGADLSGFEHSGLLVYKDQAASRHLEVGDTVAMRFAKTGVQEVPVRGIFTDQRAVGTAWLLSLPQYETNYVDQETIFAALETPPGMSQSTAAQRLDQVVAEFPNVKAETRSEFKDSQVKQLDQLLNMIYVLLLLAVIIALIGIVNTLALSVFERTRELGLLRAVGMSRRQLRRMVRYEAVIIAVFGSLLGLGLGILFGAALVGALSDQGFFFAVPVGQLVGFLVLAALAGVLAAVFPARRAARLDVLRAITTE